ncbi:unnamed protein product [Gongylonema pulchrum]|uniref:Phage protein n=1 Tax=Gongylonema pulchrum TaxID=637853 RepID=A0A183DUG7_9BILA|nr:unnamed protein product [Gongylonema pulchrum]
MINVKNRLQKIRTTTAQFKYIPNADNPAYIATRGTTVKKLQSSWLWWNGLEWISREQNE